MYQVLLLNVFTSTIDTSIDTDSYMETLQNIYSKLICLCYFSLTALKKSFFLVNDGLTKELVVLSHNHQFQYHQKLLVLAQYL